MRLLAACAASGALMVLATGPTGATSRGVAVVGVSSLGYFWQRKTPAQVGADLRSLLSAVMRLPPLCVMGEDDTESACRGLANVPVFRVARLPGSHHFDGNYAVVGDTITRFIQEVAGRDQGPGMRLRFGLPSHSSPRRAKAGHRTPDDK